MVIITTGQGRPRGRDPGLPAPQLAMLPGPSSKTPGCAPFPAAQPGVPGL